MILNQDVYIMLGILRWSSLSKYRPSFRWGEDPGEGSVLLWFTFLDGLSCGAFHRRT